MTKSLLATAAALALIAGAAMAQEAVYESRTVTTTDHSLPLDIRPSKTVTVEKRIDPITGVTVQTTETAQADTATSTTVRTVDPVTGATIEKRETTTTPAGTVTTRTTTSATVPTTPEVRTYHEEREVTPQGSTVQKSMTTETSTPTRQSNTYTRSTTTTTTGD